MLKVTWTLLTGQYIVCARKANEKLVCIPPKHSFWPALRPESCWLQKVLFIKHIIFNSWMNILMTYFGHQVFISWGKKAHFFFFKFTELLSNQFVAIHRSTYSKMMINIVYKCYSKSQFRTVWISNVIKFFFKFMLYNVSGTCFLSFRKKPK